MAGGPGYWLTVLNDGSAALVKTQANQTPQTVNGQGLKRVVYMGASRQNVIGNWRQGVKDLYPLNVGLTELPPPGAESAIIGSGTDVGTLLDYADKHGAGVMTKTTGNAEADPTFTILAGGLGGVIAGAVTSASSAAAADAAAGATGGDATAGAAAGGAAGGGAAAAAKKALSKAGSAIASNAGTVAGAAAIAGLFTNMSWWKAILFVVSGLIFIILAMRQFA